MAKLTTRMICMFLLPCFSTVLFVALANMHRLATEAPSPAAFLFRNAQEQDAIGGQMTSEPRRWIIVDRVPQCSTEDGDVVDSVYLVANTTGVYNYNMTTCVTIRISVDLQGTCNLKTVHNGRQDLNSWRIRAFLYAVKKGGRNIYLGRLLPNDVIQLEISPGQDEVYTYLIHNTTKQPPVIRTANHFWCELSNRGTCVETRDPNSKSRDYISCWSKAPPLFLGFINKMTNQPHHVARSRSPMLSTNPDLLYDFRMDNVWYLEDSLWLAFTGLLPEEKNTAAVGLFVQLLLTFVDRRATFAGGVYDVTSTLKETPSSNIQTLRSHAIAKLGKRKTYSFQEIVETLSDAFFDKGLFDREVREFVTDWLDDLVSVGYADHRRRDACMMKKDAKTCSTRRYIYWPPTFQDKLNANSDGAYQNRRLANDLISRTCPGGPPQKQLSSSALHKLQREFSNVLLIIWYVNSVHYNNMKYLETFYRPTFPNILYCGPESAQLHHEGMLRNFSASLVEYPTEFCTGLNGCSQTCIKLAHQMEYTGITGYLVIGDDVQLNFWNIRNLDRAKMWFVAQCDAVKTRGIVNFLTNKICEPVDCKSLNNSGSYPRTRDGRCVVCNEECTWGHMKRTRHTLVNLMKRLNSSDQPDLQQCYKNNLKKFGSDQLIQRYGTADIFYIPRARARTFSQLATVFWEERVFPEIGVVNMCSCMTSSEDSVVRITGHSDWTAKRGQPWTFYKTSLDRMYIHPCKLGLIEARDPYRRFYCDIILPTTYTAINNSTN